MDIATLIGYILTPVTGVVSWLAGTRSRRNTAIQELLATINSLSTQNSELARRVIGLQDEIVEVRRENAELKAGQEAMTRQMEELKAENKELKSLLTNKS